MCKDGACGTVTDDDDENDSPEVAALKKELQELTESGPPIEQHVILANTVIDMQHQALVGLSKLLRMDRERKADDKGDVTDILQEFALLLQVKELAAMIRAGRNLYDASSKDVPVLARFADLGERIQAQAKKERPGEEEAKEPEVEVKFAFVPAGGFAA